MSKFLDFGKTKNLAMTCFVCDQKVIGEKVILATSVSTHSKVSLPEKISQLIGDDYVVAVTEQDCVCKRCASLLNHMDKLESELQVVKQTLTAHLFQKYNINDDVNPTVKLEENIPNGVKNESVEGQQQEKPTPASTTKVNQAPPASKVAASPKPAKPAADTVTKLKIYKCGFCSYQSKELSNVRIHMKNHLKTKTEPEAPKPSTPIAPLKNTSPKNTLNLRRRVFKCQVCSASFEDRNKCLDHISKEHTAAGRKLGKQKTAAEDDQKESQSQESQPDQSSETPNINSQESIADVNNQDDMDTTEPPSIGIYRCESCPKTFDNDVDFANHANEHINAPEKTDDAKLNGNETLAKSQESNFTTDSDNAAASKDAMGLDIEAMIAALHSEGSETTSDSMPAI